MIRHVTSSLMLLATAVFVAGCGSRVDFGPVADARSAEEIRKAFGGGNEAAADAAGGATAAATGTGWGTLKGRFTFDGTPPQMSPYAVTKDQATCAPGGKPPLQQTLLVDNSTKGIKNIAIYALKASRVHESAQPKSAPVVFDQKECLFLTHVCGVTVGQELDIKNSDNVGHNTNIGGRNTFNQTIPAGQSIAYKVQKEEALPAPVNCSIHPWMSAYLLRRPNGYFTVTAVDGTFEIPNLPAGEKLELQVWHESSAGPSGGLIVTSPEAKSVGWTNKGRFTITLEPDQTKELNIVVPSSAFGG